MPNVTVYSNAYQLCGELISAMHDSPAGRDYTLGAPAEWHDTGGVHRIVRDRRTTAQPDDTAFEPIESLFNLISELLDDFSVRHNLTLETASYTKLEVRYYQAPTACSWHSDLDLEHDKDYPNYSVTINCYLNDDYEGGELAFKYDDTEELLAYRPKAGDVIIFPSASPLRHSVKWVTAGRRYFTNIMLIERDRPSWHLANKP